MPAKKKQARNVKKAKLTLGDTTSTLNLPTWDTVAKLNILSKTKIKIAKHKAKEKVILGAKGTGKSIIPMIKAIIMFESDPYFNAYGFRKYKDQATQKMSDLFNNALNILKQRGIDFPKLYMLKTQKAAVYKLNHTVDMARNQGFQFGSLDNASGSTDGGAPANGGYYGLATIDEPVIEADAGNPDKIPTKEEWETTTSIIRDNLDRFNDNLEDVTGKHYQTEMYYTMNNWGNHPIIVETEEVLPEMEFVEWTLGYKLNEIMGNEALILGLFENEEWVNKLITNNTQMKYVEATDKLYVRMTKFANPNNWKEKRLKPLLSAIKRALLLANKSQLTILLGTKTIPEVDKEMLVYDIPNYNNEKTLQEFLDDGYEVTHCSYSVDRDANTQNTLTPVLALAKYLHTINGTHFYKRLVYIDTQIEMKTWGRGKQGEVHDIYTQTIYNNIVKHWKNTLKKSRNIMYEIRMDSDQMLYMNNIVKLGIPFKCAKSAFQKTGNWATEERQNLLTAGFATKSLYMSPENKLLVEDMQNCVKRDINDPRRKITSTTNKLDRLDSAENGVIKMAKIIIDAGGVIWKKQKSQN